jgi:hypothetical protein
MIDFWVQFAISILKVLLTQLHVDTNKQSIFRTVLLDLANGIYIIYGITPPVTLTSPVTPPPAA